MDCGEFVLRGNHIVIVTMHIAFWICPVAVRMRYIFLTIWSQMLPSKESVFCSESLFDEIRKLYRWRVAKNVADCGIIPNICEKPQEFVRNNTEIYIQLVVVWGVIQL